MFKQLLIDELGGECQGCGYAGSLQALEFHHLGNKKDGISKLIARSSDLTKILSEVSKCVLLCANCHREVHAGLRECPKKIRLDKKTILSKYKCTDCRKQITIWSGTGKCLTCSKAG